MTVLKRDYSAIGEAPSLVRPVLGPLHSNLALITVLGSHLCGPTGSIWNSPWCPLLYTSSSGFSDTSLFWFPSTALFWFLLTASPLSAGARGLVLDTFFSVPILPAQVSS